MQTEKSQIALHIYAIWYGQYLFTNKRQPAWSNSMTAQAELCIE